MDPSRDVKSLVRGWLWASPQHSSSVKLTPPSRLSFSPRPERLGLGAVPPRDLEKQVYQSRLEKRIERKLLGKRRTDDAPIGCEVVSLAAKDASCDSADDVCSRSTAIRSKSRGHPAAVANPPKKNRKRKRKRKREPSSSSAAIIPTTEDCKPVCVAAAELPEDPLPRGRRDLLRGGAQQNSETRTKHLRTEQRVSPVTDERGSPIESGENELHVRERETIARELGEGGVKKVKVCRSVLRVRSSLPWGSSSVRWWLRRAQHKCKFRPNIQRN